MTNPPFDLELALRQWAKQLDAHAWIESGDRAELISHLRDKYDDLILQGKAPQDAFDEAANSFNIDAQLSQEYQRSRLSPHAEQALQFNLLGMLFLNIRSAVRSIFRRKVDFLVNVVGLTVAFASAILINQYIQFEESHDTSLPGHEQVYRISAESFNLDDNTLRGRYAGTFYAAAPEVAAEVPEVESATRLLRLSGFMRRGEDMFSEEDMYYGDGNFFDVFGLELLRGVGQDLDEINTVFLAASTAEKYFGNTDPIGQNLVVTLQGGAKFNLEVRGIYADLPENAHLKIDALISNMNYEGFIAETNAFGQRSLHDVQWRLSGFLHYVRLKSGADPELLQPSLDQILERNRGEIDRARGVKNVIWLEQLQKIHMGAPKVWEVKEKGDPYMVLFLKVILVVILVLAWINYVNLTIAKSMIRAKEVGITKIVGSSRAELAIRFIAESLLINLGAFAVAVLMVPLIVPEFHELLGKNVFETFDLSTLHWIQFMVIVAIGMIVSSVYPALVLSSFTPASVLKGSVKTSNKGILLRKILVIFQFGICLVLMVFLYTLDSQVCFMKQSDLGFDLRRDIIIERPIANDSVTNRKLMVFKNEALQSTDIIDATISNFVPGLEILFQTGTRRLGLVDRQEDVFLNRLSIDERFIDFYGLEVIAGRPYYESSGANSNYILLNRTATEHFGFAMPEDALGERLAFTLGDTVEIIGVVEDFAQQGLKMSYLPIGVQLNLAGQGTYISLATNAALGPKLAKLEQQFHALFPTDPFEYFVLDSRYNEQYKEEERYGSIFQVFTLIALIISMLGIVSLASFAIRIRGKEIAVRKVLGASYKDLLTLLSQEYVLLVGLAGLISLPIGYWLMDSWLESFAFRIDLTPGLFLLPLMAVIIIVLLLVSKYVIGAALSAPVHALRDE